MKKNDDNPIKRKMMRIEKKAFKTSELLVNYMNKKFANDSATTSFNKNIKNILTDMEE